VKVQRGANIDSDHILVVITLRVKICRALQKQVRRVEKLKSKDVRTQYRNELEFKFQSAHDVHPCSLNEFSYETEDKIKKVANTTMGYVQKPQNQEWFDEECATVNEENNRTRVRAIQIQNRTRAAKLTAMYIYRLARTRDA
jgi:hypothetical protein